MLSFDVPIEKKVCKIMETNELRSARGVFLQNLYKDCVFFKIHSPDVKTEKKFKFGGDLRNLINFAKRRQAKKELLLKQ